MHHEYPKMLYQGGDTAAEHLIVNDEAEGKEARKRGFDDPGEDPNKAAREKAEKQAKADKEALAAADKAAEAKRAEEAAKAAKAEASTTKAQGK